ncbi:unnamed protein product [Ectocarpus sp. 13 AM-2016]
MNHRRRKREINNATAVASLLGLALSRSTSEALRPAFVGPVINAPHVSAKAASGAAGSVQHCSLLPVRRDGSIGRAARSYGNRECARILRLRAAGYGAAFGRGDGKEKEDEEEKEEEDVAAKNKRLLERAAAAVRTADQGRQRDQGEQGENMRQGERMEKRDVFGRRRRRANAKIQAVPVLDSSCELTAGGGSPEAPILNFGRRGGSCNSNSGASSSGVVDVATAGGGGGSGKIEPKMDRRRWGPAAVGSAIFGMPMRFVRRKVDDCRSFVVSRERVHWASLAMASYIFATSVLPRLPAGTSTEGSTAGEGRSYGGYNYHDDDGEDSTLPSPGLHPYDGSPAMTSKRRGGYPQRSDYYHDDGGGIGTTITHLDDHAEQLWHNSPAIRAAAAAAAAAAAEAAGDSLDREAGPSPRIGAPPPSTGAAASEREAWQEGPGKEKHRVPREPFDGSAEREALFSDGDGLDGDGLAVDDDCVGVDPDLRTHFDLGDLELAAEKALDLLRDSGDVSGGDRGDGATEPEDGIDESGPELRPDLEDLELAAEKALDLLRDDGGGARGQDSAGRQDDGGTSAAAAAAAASVTGRSTGVPVRLTVGVDTDDAAAVPAHGGAAPLSADSSQQVADSQQEQKEEEGKSSSSTRVAVVGGKEKTSGGRLTLPSPPTPAPKVPPAAAIGGSGGGAGTPGRHSTSFVAVAARAVSPAVCRIDMERLVGTRHDGSPFPDVETGQGSGLIFSSEDGLVLTNAHVVAGARKVTVTLTDGRKFLAEVKGSDALSDLAVLKIDRDASLGQTPLPEVTLGDSQELQVGDWVIAVGNPVGLDSTVTLGIVSR